MRVVIDTNCFLAIIPKLSPYRSVFDAFRMGKFELAISTEILKEYEEVFANKMTPEIAYNLLELIDRQLNTVQTEVYFRWGLIKRDPDDNKFADCAIATQADFIITHNGHFSDLDSVTFPLLRRITLPAFMELLKDK
jgi:putative PIN family toxin of toxin-antitoxin system